MGEQASVTSAPTNGSGRLHSLDLLRAIASLTVFYVHLSAWFRYQGGPTAVTELLDRWVVRPAHLNQDFAFLGVALFFLVSGFVISNVAVRETLPEFAVKRLSRIVPVLVVAVLLAAALVSVGALRTADGSTDIAVRDVLAGMGLVNFFWPPAVTLVGVAWTLVIQLAVYAMTCAMLALMRREPWLVIAIEITVCAVILSVVRNYGGLPNATIANIGAFGTAVILGQVIWAVWSRRVPVWAGVALGAACWVVFLWGDSLGYGRYDDSYPLTLAVAALLMVLALAAERHVRPTSVVSYLSSRSYSTYLLHQTVAFSVLAATADRLGRWPAAILAVAATFAAVEIVHRAVERPIGRAARTLLGRARRTPDRTGAPR